MSIGMDRPQTTSDRDRRPDARLGDVVEQLEVVHVELVDASLARGDAHRREGVGRAGQLPTMRITPGKTSIDEFDLDDFELVDYVADPSIRAPIAV